MAVTEGQLISDGTAVWKVKKIGSEVPAGIMQMFAGNTIPAGWLLCDGSAISRTDYAKLFSAIGTTWGAGDGSTTFNLPNSIGRFAEGAATSGSYKSAGLPNITGQTTKAFLQDSVGTQPTNHNGAIENVQGANIQGAGGTTYGTMFIKLDASMSNPIYGNSDTVQPNSFTVRYIIKY